MVLGQGAQADPAAELAPVIEATPESGPEFVVVVVGTEDDPQGLHAQVDRLLEAGATVFEDPVEAVRFSTLRLGLAPPDEPHATREEACIPGSVPVSAGALTADAGSRPAIPGAEVRPDLFGAPLVAVNLGVETFYHSLREQGVAAVHVDWRPPAGGDERLLSLLDRLSTQ